MADFSKELLTLLSTDLFLNLMKSGSIKLTQIYTLQTLLIKADIPFDFQYSPGTRKIAPGAELTIHIRPGVRLQFTISFDGGGTIFDIIN